MFSLFKSFLCSNLSIWLDRPVVFNGSRCYILIFDGLVNFLRAEGNLEVGGDVQPNTSCTSPMIWQSSAQCVLPLYPSGLRFLPRNRYKCKFFVYAAPITIIYRFPTVCYISQPRWKRNITQQCVISASVSAQHQ